MILYKKSLLFLILFSLISCGKNEEQEAEQKGVSNPELKKDETIYETPQDSIRAVKESVLRKQNYRRKKRKGNEEKQLKGNSGIQTVHKSVDEEGVLPSFIYIKKVLEECEIGVPMTQKELETNFDIPKEAVKLVKIVTKISDNELDIKWKSTWFIEKMSDAKFNDGRLKVRFEKNRMYTSGGAIGIKYEKKLYTDLYLIGRSAYIPSVKGYYWQIGK